MKRRRRRAWKSWRPPSGFQPKLALAASQLSYGDQRRLEIARALATGARLILLDEPTAGMSPTEVDEILNLVVQLRDSGVTVVLIEHNMSLVMRVSDRVVVLDHGVKIAEGRPGRGPARPRCAAGVSWGNGGVGMLQVRSITVAYAIAPVLRDVSLDVQQGEIVALIGANGAGKTTLMKTISGLLPCRNGSIHFEDHDITSRKPGQIVRLGISQVPEGRHIFREMSVVENLEMGAYCRHRQAAFASELDEIYAIFPVLSERRTQLAETLSGGEQQMLAIGRALMAKPRLLLLDEPSMGLAPKLVSRIFEVLKRIQAQARRSCSWSRTRVWPCAIPIGPMCSKRDRS